MSADPPPETTAAAIRERLLHEAREMAEMQAVASVLPDGRVTWSEPYLSDLVKLFKDTADLLDAQARQQATSDARVLALTKALEEALNEWEYASQYKGDHLAKKHGDAERIVELRAALSAPPETRITTE